MGFREHPGGEHIHALGRWHILIPQKLLSLGPFWTLLYISLQLAGQVYLLLYSL